jgi:hypothetical protein
VKFSSGTSVLFGSNPGGGGTGTYHRLYWFGGTLNIDTNQVPSFGVWTSAVFRDYSAWCHIVLAFDTTQGTDANRVKLYVNGVLQNLSGTWPALNTDYPINNAVPTYLGADGAFSYCNGCLADIHFIDGQALDPTSFGEFSATTGVWMPKAYTGTYGTNGFRLTFADNSAATATTLGKDAAGSNNWTPNNFSVTAGAGNDSLVDVPVNGSEVDTGAGGQVRGNYCTLNPLITTSSTLSNGNLDYASNATYQSSYGTVAVRTGKWYWEGTVGTFATDALIGIGSAPFSTATYVGGSATSWGYEGAFGRIYNNGAFSAYGATFVAGAIIGVAFDADTGKLWFAKNGTWQASGNPAAGTSPAVTLTTGIDYFFGVSAGSGGTWSSNFGQLPFAYTAPSGFKALNTANLPAGTITTSGTFTGNADTNGPFVWLNGVPIAMTINSNTVTFGTHADKLANGFKVRSSSGSYNTAGSNTYSITTTGAKFNVARAQLNP